MLRCKYIITFEGALNVWHMHSRTDVFEELSLSQIDKHDLSFMWLFYRARARFKILLLNGSHYIIWLNIKMADSKRMETLQDFHHLYPDFDDISDLHFEAVGEHQVFHGLLKLRHHNKS